MGTKLKKYILMIVGVILAVLLIYLLYRDYRPEINVLIHPTGDTQEKLLVLIRKHEIRDSLFLLALVAILNAIPGLSNSLVCILAGLCYGPWIGLMINWIGNVLGNSIIIMLIKKIDFSHHFKQNKILNFLMHQNHPLVGLTIGFMIPFIPSILVNYACGRLKVTWKRYLPMVIIGMLPTSYLYAFGGDAVFHGDAKKIIGVIIGIVILLVMAVIVIKLAGKSRNRA